MLAPGSDPSGPEAGYAWPAAHPPVLEQLRMWFLIGARSFGGGPAVQLLAFDALVTRRRWISPVEYARLWGLCQVVPGINLLSLAVLVGYRAGGVAGMVSGLLGMVVPGTVVIVLCTIGYAHVSRYPLTVLALRGSVAGVAGMGLFMAWRLLRPQFEESMQEGWPSVVASLAVLLGAGLAFSFLPHLPIVLVFLAAALLMAGIGWSRRRRPLPGQAR